MLISFLIGIGFISISSIILSLSVASISSTKQDDISIFRVGHNTCSALPGTGEQLKDSIIRFKCGNGVKQASYKWGDEALIKMTPPQNEYSKFYQADKEIKLTINGRWYFFVFPINFTKSYTYTPLHFSCTETDNGIDLGNMGVCIDKHGVSHADECFIDAQGKHKIRETFCDEWTGLCGVGEYYCALQGFNSCESGACIR